MPNDTAVRLAPPDFNFAFKRIPPIQFLLSFEERLDPARLRSALDAVLEDFWILRGRLEVDSDDEEVIRVPRHRRDSIPVRVEDVEAPFVPGSTAPGFEHIDEASRGVGGPLARVRIGQARGSTCLGISVAHAAGDGSSFFAFVDAWARAYSGHSYPTPTFDRDSLRVDLPTDETPLSTLEIERATGYLYGQTEYPPVGALVRDRLVFSAAQVAGLREEARAQDLTPTMSSPPVRGANSMPMRRAASLTSTPCVALSITAVISRHLAPSVSEAR